MRRHFQFTAEEALPARRVILKAQGIPGGAEVSERTEALIAEASDLFLEKARPVGLFGAITPPEFSEVYAGEGENDSKTPLHDICPHAVHLALFAATLGKAVCAEIDNRFDAGDFAVGSMLDSFASAGAENLGQLLSDKMSEELRSSGGEGDRLTTLAYSPGYCGWDVSGQKKLFACLRPVETGIELKEGSHLMVPIKSISGVLISGGEEIHFFDNHYMMCDSCRDKTCLIRQRDLRGESRKRDTGEGECEGPAMSGGIS